MGRNRDDAKKSDLIREWLLGVITARFREIIDGITGSRSAAGRQLLLFDDIPVPSNGVRTSNDAAAAMKRDSSRLRRLVFRLIERHGGLTCQEVERMTGISHETISARIWELHTRGWLRDSGKTRRTEARRKAIVWAVPAQPKKKKKEGENHG